METLEERQARQRQEHIDKYTTIVEKLGGTRAFELFLPENVSVLREKLAEDEHLNNIPLNRWDRLDGRVRYLAHGAGFRYWSLSDTVCTAKQAARMLVNES